MRRSPSGGSRKQAGRTGDVFSDEASTFLPKVVIDRKKGRGFINRKVRSYVCPSGHAQQRSSVMAELPAARKSAASRRAGSVQTGKQFYCVPCRAFYWPDELTFTDGLS